MDATIIVLEGRNPGELHRVLGSQTPLHELQGQVSFCLFVFDGLSLQHQVLSPIDSEGVSDVLWFAFEVGPSEVRRVERDFEVSEV